MKCKLKALLFFGLLIMLQNCETRFEDDTRILVKGTIEDGLGNPIPDVEISVYRGELFVFLFAPLPSFDDEYLLGQNYSNSEGEFSVTSLYDKDQYFKIILDAGDAYTQYIYQSNTEDYIPSDLTFNLDAVTLYKLGTLNFAISRTSGDGNSIEYTFRYSSPLCVEYYEEEIINIEESNCYRDEFFNGTLNDENPNIESQFNVSVGTQVEFTYSVNGAPEITETFIINQENYEFTFSY